MGPTQAVADVRRAVRNAVQELAGDSLVLVACSGGADSVALAAALAFEAPRLHLRAGAVTVDHRLQAGSDTRATAVVALLAGLGLDPVSSVAVDVDGPGGPEAAARVARYGALERTAERTGAVAVLLGHTLDDQAETVLLGLARGSGTRSIAGMAAIAGPNGLYRRPLLGLVRTTTQAACADAELPLWTDPHNADPAFARVRVRTRLLPALEAELGPGIAAALARTAALARDDADALESWADRVFAELAHRGADGSVELDAQELAGLPAAVRRRVLRSAALAAGATPGALAAVHLLGMDALVTDWRGQGVVALPGGLAFRRYGRLTVSSTTQPNP